MDANILSQTVTLFASGLYSKWGFMDGDILHDAFFEMQLPGDDHDVLVALVRDKLLAILPHPVKIFTLSSCHNLVRVEQEHHEDDSKSVNADCSIDVTYDEIRRYAEVYHDPRS